jgi:hypothetical protein
MLAGRDTGVRDAALGSIRINSSKFTSSPLALSLPARFAAAILMKF